MTTALKKTVGMLAAEAIETFLQAAESYETATLKDQDPENLHQMRVNLRRLRTAMQVFSPSIQLPRAGQEARVAQVARRLGTLRDLDVVLTTLQNEYRPDLPEAERVVLSTLAANLEKNRKKAFKQVKRELRGDRYQTLKARLHKWAAAPKCHASAQLTIETVLPDLIQPAVSQLWLQSGWLVSTEPTASGFKPVTPLNTPIDELVAGHSQPLHSLRKQVKRVRYQLKFVSSCYGDRLDSELARLADLQDVLGTLQDSLIMASFLQAAVPKWPTKLPTLKALLAAQRQRIWQQWQTHQQYYLKPENRAALRQILLQPGTLSASPKAPKAKAKATTKKAAATASSRRTPKKSTSARSTKSSTRTKKTGGSQNAADNNSSDQA
ncbi:MAG: CHAD domain-containing protein [Cyanobacteria bacterium P01_D01_bin.115]